MEANPNESKVDSEEEASDDEESKDNEQSSSLPNQTPEESTKTETESESKPQPQKTTFVFGSKFKGPTFKSISSTESKKDLAEHTNEVSETEKKEVFQQIEVSSGEEDEVTLHSVRAKLYVFEDAWKERGIGTVKLNTKTSESGCRLGICF